MKVILNNGIELTPILVTGGPKYFQNTNRDVLSFIFSVDNAITELDAAFVAENCEKITIIGDDGSENIHTGYTIRMELSKSPVEVTPATAENAAVYEDRITVSMAQRNYMESQLAAMQAAMTQMNQ